MNDEHRSGQALNISWSQSTDAPAGNAWNDVGNDDQGFRDEPVVAPPRPAARPAAPQVVTQHTDIPADAVTIGRSRSNVIVLDDMLVSRRHVLITADEEGLLVRDLDSRNGTFVNGERIEATHVDEGDRISIGASTFEVRDGWLVSV